MTKVHRQLKQLRLEKGYTQEKVAEKIGLTRQAISSYESGRTQPSIDILMQFARIYDVEIDEILYGKRTTKKNNRYLKLSTFCVLTIWTCSQLVNIVLLSIAERLYPIDIYGETAAILKNNDIHFQLLNISSRFDQSALHVMFFGSVILILMHLLLNESVSKKMYIKFFAIVVMVTGILLLLAFLLLKDNAINVLVTLRFSWYILIAALLLDIVLQWIKKSFKFFSA